MEVLRILISIGPTETMHFQTWSDKAGNALPLTAVDPVTGVSVTFPDLEDVGEDLQKSLIMPEPCPFLSRKLPPCSIIRPTETKGVAMGAVKFLTDMGLSSGNHPPSSHLCKIWPRTRIKPDADDSQVERERKTAKGAFTIAGKSPPFVILGASEPCMSSNTEQLKVLCNDRRKFQCCNSRLQISCWNDSGTENCSHDDGRDGSGIAPGPGTT